jgi:hypothetical protein
MADFSVRGLKRDYAAREWLFHNLGRLMGAVRPWEGSGAFAHVPLGGRELLIASRQVAVQRSRKIVVPLCGAGEFFGRPALVISGVGLPWQARCSRSGTPALNPVVRDAI